MLHYRMLSLTLCLSLLLGCAAIQGAHGDEAAAKAAAAQQAAASQNEANSGAAGVEPQSITPPVQPRTPAQNAQENASKMIAPLAR